MASYAHIRTFSDPFEAVLALTSKVDLAHAEVVERSILAALNAI
jgi:hypothetical protein